MPVRLGLQGKMLLFTVGIVAVLTGLSLIVIQRIVINQVQRRIALDLAQTQAVFQRFMQERVVWLRSQCEVVAEDPRFLATLDLQAPYFQTPDIPADNLAEHARTVLREAKRFQSLIDSDVFMVTNPSGHVLARIDVFQSAGDDLLGYPTIKPALDGAKTAGQWRIDGYVYEMATVPVRKNDRVIGTLSIGYIEQVGTENLLEDLTRLADEEQFPEAFPSDRAESIIEKTLTIEQAFGCDLVAVTDGSGKSRILRIHKTDYSNNASFSPWVRSALNGESASGFQTDRGRIVQTVVIPVWSSEGLIGTLSAGFEINDRLAYDLRNMTHSAVSFAVNDRVIASTWPENTRRELEHTLLEMSAKPGAETSVSDIKIGSETYSSLTGDLDLGDSAENGIYIIQVSINQAAAFLNTIERVLLLIGASILIASGWISFWGVTRVVHPVRALADGTRRLASGDLTYRIPVPSQDEIGQLAGSFNEMVAALEKSRDALNLSTGALQKSEALYQSTFNEAPVGIVHTGMNGRFLRVNKRLCDIIGYSQEALLASCLQDLVHMDDMESATLAISRILSGEVQSCILEERYIRPDETIVWTVRTVSLQRDDSGAPQYFINVIEDVSQRKQLEAQLIQAQKMEAIGRLAGGVAHDFNNLLTVINGYADLLIRKLINDRSSHQQVQGIRKAGERAAGLTSHLLAFSRRQVLQPKVIDLNAVIADNMKILQRLIGEDIEIVSLLEPRLWRVKTDPGQMAQVVMNLVVNARDAMPQGGTLTIETANVELDEGYAQLQMGPRSGRHAVLTISDTGHGMDQKTVSHIFEPFFTTKDPGKGTGLGLSTVYGIVQQTGGDIWVDSTVGVGTIFKIYLPSVDHLADAREGTELATATPDGSETILLVEDEESVRDLTHDILKESGYTVLEASNGLEALQLGERYSQPIHLMVTDVVMPHMSGPELAGRMAALRPGMKVMYMSGYPRDFINQHGVLESSIVLLQKPFTPEALECKVREVLDEA